MVPCSESEVGDPAAGAVQTHLNFKSSLIRFIAKGCPWKDDITPQPPRRLLAARVVGSCGDLMNERVLFIGGECILIRLQETP